MALFLASGTGSSNFGDLALGVKKGAKSAPQKISTQLPYTQRQLSSNLRILDRVKKGDVKVSDLESEVEKVYTFLKNLKQ